MRGRQVFMESLVAHGVERIFGNPGTTESPLLDSLAAYPSIRYVTALHESIALCAASYYAQASGKTGVVSLHVAPGLGNAIGMMYGALRASSPMVVTAGQQDTRLRLNNPVLGHDLVAMAAPVTKWSVQVERADEMAPILRRAFKVAHDGAPGPVFVALPINVMEQETATGPAKPAALARAPLPQPEGVAAIAGLLLSAKSPVIVAGDDAARSGATAALVELAELVGASVWSEGLKMHGAFPSPHPSARLGLPLDSAAIAKSLAGADVVLLIGGSFFEDVWHAGEGPFPAGARIAQVEAYPERLAFGVAPETGLCGDIRAAVEGIVAAVRGGADAAFSADAKRRNAALVALKAKEEAVQKARAEKAWDRVPISMPRVMAEIREAIPAGSIIVDESITASIDLARSIPSDGPGTYFGAKCGGIGQGLAGALGVQVAKPDRPVICISGDGSSMYSIQALWTAAHCKLSIVFIILANGEYRVLKHNIDVYRQKFAIASQEPYAHMDLGTPTLGFVEMATGMGVAGTRVTTGGDIGPAIKAALAGGRPHVIEIAIEAKR
ncbi:MAG: thiamine pyrophosphate-binding protein [Hyphomicrobiaceae bacterium]|nr:thiamine pyrophosphate-binding protein [Hyphomicrobiaceae bacterium]